MTGAPLNEVANYGCLLGSPGQLSLLRAQRLCRWLFFALIGTMPSCKTCFLPPCSEMLECVFVVVQGTLIALLCPADLVVKPTITRSTEGTTTRGGTAIGTHSRWSTAQSFRAGLSTTVSTRTPTNSTKSSWCWEEGRRSTRHCRSCASGHTDQLVNTGPARVKVSLVPRQVNVGDSDLTSNTCCCCAGLAQQVATILTGPCCTRTATQ